MDKWKSILRVLEKWENLGEKTTSMGTRLIGHVPHVAPEAWFHQVFWSLQNSEIIGIEAQLNCLLPASFKGFLAITNGLKVFSNNLSIYGKRYSYDRQGDKCWQPYDLVDHTGKYEKPVNRPLGVVFIGGYSMDGSRLFFNADSSCPECIYRTSREEFKILNTWPDFWTMLENEVNRLASLFDENGKLTVAKEKLVPEADL
jgi:hypothetical protein